MILLTGASGFLGRQVRKVLEDKHLPFITAGRSNKDNLQLDLTTPYTQKIPDNITHIFHVAGLAHRVPRNEQQAHQFFDVNVKGTENLLAAIGHPGQIKQFVYISSVAVYGKGEGEHLDESTPLNATDPYGKSKIAAEELVEKWCEEHKVPYYILRLPLLVGNHAPGNLGSMVKGIRTGRYARIGKGLARKSMVLAEDVAALMAAIQGPPGAYNLTDGEHPSFAELENKISSALGKRPPMALPMILLKAVAFAGDILGSWFPLNTSRLKKITSTLTFDDQRARQLLGWNPKRVVDAWEIEY